MHDLARSLRRGVLDVESHLGGVFVWRSGSAYREVAAWIMDGISCRKVRFTIGNPDTVMEPGRSGLFLSILGIEDVEVAGQPITLCHYPMRSWNKSYHGAWLLYGYVHGRNWEGDLRGSSLRLDVRVDTPPRLRSLVIRGGQNSHAAHLAQVPNQSIEARLITRGRSSSSSRTRTDPVLRASTCEHPKSDRLFCLNSIIILSLSPFGGTRP